MQEHNWLNTPLKSRAKVFKDLSRGMNQVEKLSLMKNMYKGERVFIVSCGPSLADIPQELLTEKLRNSVVLTIKQAFGKVGHISDIHHFNCNNFTKYDLSETISIGSAGVSSLEAMRRGLWGDVEVDMFFPVINSGRTICHDNSWENNTYDNNPITRQWGPGTIKETTIFSAVHVGASHISLIGIDLAPASWDESKDGIYIPHFYDSESQYRPQNSPKGQLFQGESRLVIDGTRQIKEWLDSRGIKFSIDSKGSFAHESIERDYWLYDA